MNEEQKQKELQKMRDEDRRHDEYYLPLLVEQDLWRIVRDFNNERRGVNE